MLKVGLLLGLNELFATVRFAREHDLNAVRQSSVQHNVDSLNPTIYHFSREEHHMIRAYKADSRGANVLKRTIVSVCVYPRDSPCNLTRRQSHESKDGRQ